MKINRDPFAYWHLPLYYYLLRTYIKFAVKGYCLDYPQSIQIQTQSRCNARCSICPYKVLSLQLPQGTMPEQLYQKIIDEVSRAPQFAQMIYELHNEPLLDKRLFGWIGDFRSRGRAKEAMIVTNGELLDQFELNDIKTSKLDAITISLNAASKETFEKINCGLNYERVMRNVEKLLKDKSPDLKVMMSFAVGDLNKTEVYEAARNWKSRGINSRIVEMTNRAGMLDNFLSLRPKQPIKEPGFHSRLRSATLSSLKNKMGCSLPFYQMNILFNGDAVICCNDWNRMTVVGNLTRNSIREIWNSEKLNIIRRQILNKDYKAIESCRDCSAAI